jgi:hypothetical protein
MRLISADALIKLVQLKENAEGAETGRKIRSLLIPREYTPRLDDMVDVMFTAAKDVESVSEAVDLEEEAVDLEEEQAAQAGEAPEMVKGIWEFTDSRALQATRDQIIAALINRDGTPLIKEPCLYWSPDHDKRAIFTISKRYSRKGGPQYWCAYHTQWDEFLKEGRQGYFVLGCMDRHHAFAIPANVFCSFVL